MIGGLLVVLVVAVAAGALGLWFGIVVFAPRLQRRIDRPGDHAEEASLDATEELDGRAD